MNRLTIGNGLVHVIISGLVCGLACGQTVSPTNPIVREGQTQRFRADRRVSWSLAPGSAGSIDPDGTYHAPRRVAAPKSLAGCQMGAPDSVFNTRIDNLPLHPKNGIWMKALPAQGIRLDPSWGINVVDNTTPSGRFSFYYTPTYNSQSFQMPAWPALKRENGVFSDPLADNDRHVMTVNSQTCQVYEVYNNYPAGTLGSTPPGNAFTAQSGWQYNSMSYSLPTGGSTSASGIPLLAGTLNLDDIRSGVIRHALLVTFANGYINPTFLWPATTNAGAYGTVPYGARLRLKSTFNISGFSPTAQVILTGLKNYGMLISDGGSNWDIVTSTDLTEDRAVQAAILEIQNSNGTLNRSQFEIVDETSLMVSPSSSQVAYNNGYVTPPAYAIVKADDGVHPPVTIPVALQGVALNSPDGGGIWIQSGVTKSLSVFVGGTANTAVRWSMNPAVGAVDPASGAYTAPSVRVPTTTSITATSVADPAISVIFPLTVLPAGPIRIVAGDATVNPAARNSRSPDYGPDSQGNMWWRDQAVERGWGVKNDYWYPAGNWPSAADISRYETQYYNIGDTVYRFLVPNGSYNIDYYVAVGGCPASGTYDPLVYREHLESQGQIAVHDYRPLATVGGACYTPIHTTIPAQVTDNTLYFALRRITDHTQSGADQSPVTILSSFSITPVTGAPHLAIDPAAPPPLTLSQTLQLNAVGWYMSNDVTWTLVSGPGTLSPTGLYTAPATPANKTAVVMATSKANPSQSATVRIGLVFGAITVVPGPLTLNRSAVQRMTARIGGQAYSHVTWTLSPDIGKIDASGLYRAPDTLDRDTVVRIKATSTDDPAQTGATSLSIRANPDSIRVNCGDNGPVTDAQGRIWADDHGFSTPSTGYSVKVPIARAPPDLQPLYQSARYSAYDFHDFYYEFPLPNGSYRLTLKFADYGDNPVGHFKFDVNVNGSAVMRQFDLVEAAGSRVAVDKTFTVKVTARELRIDFIGGSRYAIVNGIEIVPLPNTDSGPPLKD